MIEVNLSNRDLVITTESLWQYDTGQQLCLTGDERLGADTEVHFDSYRLNRAIVKTGVYDAENHRLTVDIPDEFLEEAVGERKRVWVYLTDSKQGKTVRELRVPVIRRTRPEDYISPGDLHKKDVIDEAVESYLDAHPVTLDEEVVTNAVNTYLDENPIMVDDTLSVNGMAANSKTVGDRLALTNEKIESLPESKYNAAGNTKNRYLDSSADMVPMTGWEVTGYLRIGRDAVYYLPYTSGETSVFCWYYDAGKTPVSSFAVRQQGTFSLTPPENAAFVRFSLKAAYAGSFRYASRLLLPAQDGVIEPYMLSRLQRTNDYKNQLIGGSCYNQSGAAVSDSDWSRTPLYAVKAGDVVSVTKPYNQYLTCFDTGLRFVSAQSSTLSAVSYVIPDGVAYIGLNIYLPYLSEHACTVNNERLGAAYTVPWLDYEPNSPDWRGKKYLSHGDSATWQDGKAYTQGSHVGETARGYQTVLKEKLKLADVNNQGRYSCPMAVVNGNGVVNTVKAIADYTAYGLCTIECGTADFKQSVPLGSPGKIGDSGFDTATFFGAYREAIEYILSSSPAVRLVLMTPLQCSNNSYDVNTVNSAGYKLINYVNAVRQLGQMYGLPVCDMYANSGITQLTMPYYTIDGLRPNDLGYERMGSALAGFLKSGGSTAGVPGVPGDDYVLTPQDKTDIANIVLQELPTTQGVLYGNESN